MKIVNNSTGSLVCTFKSGSGVGCGFVPPGESIEKNFSQPTTVIITINSNEPIQYSNVTTETISVTSNIS